MTTCLNHDLWETFPTQARRIKKIRKKFTREQKPCHSKTDTCHGSRLEPSLSAVIMCLVIAHLSRKEHWFISALGGAVKIIIKKTPGLEYNCLSPFCVTKWRVYSILLQTQYGGCLE